MRLQVPRVRLAEGPTAVRPFVRADLDALLALRIQNRDFLAPFEAVREETFFTRAAQSREITLDGDAWTAGLGFAFAVVHVHDDATERLIGRVALSNIVRGAWQNATVGYWISEDACGLGHASTALELVLEFAFDHAGLHRVQPAIMPRNVRSRRVVEKNGFRHEGTAIRYLQIDGVWEDHDIFALTSEEWHARRG
ncbi:[Ribosomal protein S5]-alanine N-acetyltransferase [Paraconexibacter sp. AEG42_29]|uniref:[Ribosomal protein S5]-alanine N-acetyltransferase n=1 Tax=Paraconexibacter sp. AEG42_29 TaxID=2997339 RepID=A0AAU7B3U5_9ACTN